MELSQEKWNMILDLKDTVNAHSKTINKMAKVINAQQEKITELEKRRDNANPLTNDMFDDLLKKQNR